jgi:hypothetical protein
MGHEFEMYEITALTLMRNDARAARFTANVQRLEQQAPLLPATPHWCKTPRDVVGCPPALNKCAPAACAVTAVQAAAVTEELAACSSAPLANVSSYCVACRCVTATFDASIGTSANLVLTHTLRREYTQHNVFQASFPSKRNFRKLLRKTSRKYGGSNKARELAD